MIFINLILFAYIEYIIYLCSIKIMSYELFFNDW